MEPNNRGEKKSEHTSCMAAQGEFNSALYMVKQSGMSTSYDSSRLLASAEKRILQERKQ